MSVESGGRRSIMRSHLRRLGRPERRRARRGRARRGAGVLRCRRARARPALRRGLRDDVDRRRLQLDEIDVGRASLDRGQVGSELLPPAEIPRDENDLGAVLPRQVLSQTGVDSVWRRGEEGDAARLRSSRRGSGGRSSRRRGDRVGRGRSASFSDSSSRGSIRGSSQPVRMTRSERSSRYAPKKPVMVSGSCAAPATRMRPPVATGGKAAPLPSKRTRSGASDAASRAACGRFEKNGAPASPPPQRRAPTVVTRAIAASSR